MTKEISYSISFKKPETHYCEVRISIKDLNVGKLLFKMPVWTPGSYLVREFSKNVDSVAATNSKGSILSCRKINKNTWEVDTNGNSEVNFSYRVYCNELTVRTSMVNSDHAFISSSGIFMYVNGYENLPCRLKVNLPSAWKKISTGLDRLSGNIFTAPDYDVFIDSPLELGNQKILEFKISGVRHYICISGQCRFSGKTLVNDFKKIAEQEIKLLGKKIPYRHYTFIIHVVSKGGGGLEHLNSFVAQISRLSFNDKKLYPKFLGLVAHEFFHLWNVKRIRPEALGPFDYNSENYTKSLWVSEGWTSFYDNLIIKRCGLIDIKEYLEFVSVEVNDIMRFKGQFSQSLEESSFDTWIKFYRKDEHFVNSQISYYTKGSIAAMMLNIEIIKSTSAKKSLDDALRMLYEDYLADPSKGFTDYRVKQICEQVCGKSLDDFWKRYISGTSEMPLKKYLNACGLDLVNEEKKPYSLGIESKTDNGKVIITKVLEGCSAYEAGLNTGDEIIAIDGIRAETPDVTGILDNYSDGKSIMVLVCRDGLIREIKVKLLKPVPKFRIIELEKRSREQNRNLMKWLNG